MHTLSYHPMYAHASIYPHHITYHTCRHTTWSPTSSLCLACVQWVLSQGWLQWWNIKPGARMSGDPSFWLIFLAAYHQCLAHVQCSQAGFPELEKHPLPQLHLNCPSWEVRVNDIAVDVFSIKRYLNLMLFKFKHPMASRKQTTCSYLAVLLRKRQALGKILHTTQSMGCSFHPHWMACGEEWSLGRKIWVAFAEPSV